jgi:hypothetical protein
LQSAKNIIAECRAERGVIEAKFPKEILPPKSLQKSSRCVQYIPQDFAINHR